MPDEQGNTKADEETDTSLHAYADGRTEDIKGDVDKFLSNDPKELNQDKIADEGEESDSISAPDKA